MGKKSHWTDDNPVTLQLVHDLTPWPNSGWPTSFYDLVSWSNPSCSCETIATWIWLVLRWSLLLKRFAPRAGPIYKSVLFTKHVHIPWVWLLYEATSWSGLLNELDLFVLWLKYYNIMFWTFAYSMCSKMVYLFNFVFRGPGLNLLCINLFKKQV